MRKNLLIYGSPIIEQPEIDEVVATLRSGWLGKGPKTYKFEGMFKKYIGSRFAIALNSCTAALHLSLLAIEINPGDEVIVPSMTFASTANVVILVGGKPIFVDCEKDTMNIEPKDIERKITSKTKAIIPVHFAGRPCDMNRIMKIARKHKLQVIEDCAHAFGAQYMGKKVGTIGDIGCFSFYVTKNITTGEGGMVVTNNRDLANKINILASQGLDKVSYERFKNHNLRHYNVIEPGLK